MRIKPRPVMMTRSARFIILAVALTSGGFAAYLASGSEAAPAPEPVAQLETVDVLVAKADIGLGQKVTAANVQWQTWPKSTATPNVIMRTARADFMKDLEGAIARAPFVTGEPIRETKLISLKGSGFMAAILPTGMRAIAIRITPETGAGGFILPNDRVDVILSRRDDQANSISSQVIARNLRVLAIDQSPKEGDGQNALIGRTTTLEASPDQAEILARSNMHGTLSLALRSIADEDKVEGNKRVAVYRGATIQGTFYCNPVCDRQ
jgi:pilus assembly protein CpaB